MQGALVGSLHGSPVSRQRLTFSYSAFKKEVGEATTGVRAWLWLGAIFGCRLPPGRRKAATRLPQGCHKAKRRPGLQDAAYACFGGLTSLFLTGVPENSQQKSQKRLFFSQGRFPVRSPVRLLRACRDGAFPCGVWGVRQVRQYYSLPARNTCKRASR